MNFNDMTVSELRKLAAELGISGRSTMKKAELIAALSADEFVSIIELKAGIAEAEAEEREMNEIRAEIAAEKSHVEALTADKVVPAGMFDPELTYYADGTYVVMRAQGTEQQGIAVGMTVNAGPYQFQAVRFSDGTVKNVAPHVLHRDDIGYLAPGMAADVTIMDWSQLQYGGGKNDPVACVVMSGESRLVDKVFVNGVKVVDGGNLTRVDEKKTAKFVNEVGKAMLRRASKHQPGLEQDILE